MDRQRKTEVTVDQQVDTPPQARRPAVDADVRGRLSARIAAVERRLDLAGVSTAVLQAGEGPPVVGLHGQGEFAALWSRVFPRLATTHRLIVPDLPGQGASEIRQGELDVDRVLGWLAELVDETCPSPPALVGHVLGGSIAARFASRYGDRISRLVLVDAFGLGPVRPAPRFVMSMAAFMVRPTERTMGGFLGQCVFDIDDVHAQMGEDWELIRAYGLEGARSPRKKAATRALMKAFGSPIPGDELARIDTPTTLIWGRHDRQVRLAVAEAASARYEWPLHVIDDCASDPNVEQPDAFVQVLRDTLDRPLS